MRKKLTGHFLIFLVYFFRYSLLFLTSIFLAVSYFDIPCFLVRFYSLFQGRNRNPCFSRGFLARWASRDTLMSRDKNCRGSDFERGKMPSLVGKRQFWGHFRRQFGRGSFRVKNRREAVGSQFLPRDIKVSRRALWVLSFTKNRECQFVHKMFAHNFGPITPPGAPPPKNLRNPCAPNS